jgi:cell division protein FtsQ
MRRPSPLPQPPAREAEPADAAPRGRRDARATRGETTEGAALALSADSSTESVRSAGPVSPSAAESGDDITAPVIPLGGPLPLPGAAREPVDGTGDAPAPGGVGFRDVWRASRARRKALRAEVRRFTVRQRRRRALWLGAAASVLILALATIGAAYSPLFAVERVVVVGAEQLDAAEIADALEGQVGTPLPLVDESAVKAELVAFPLVESYTLEARPPHDLVVRIVERTPIGLIETRAGYTLVDAAGVALSTSAQPSPGTPVLSITGGVNSDAFSAAGQVMRSLPEELRVQVTAVSATTPDDVTLSLGESNAQVVWGSAEESAKKALVLARAMISRPPASVISYDVSSPDAIVIR